MSPTDIVTFALFALLAGLLIGCVGIGGVILVPLLSYAGGVPIHVAIAAAMFAYIVSGAIGTFIFASKKSIRWDLTIWMWAGAMPAAFAGALTAITTSAWVLELCIGFLTAGSGLNVLLAHPSVETETDGQLGKPALSIIGAVTGFASAMTGTGGPLILIPILMYLEIPVLTSIGLAQAIQLPIAFLATAGNVFADTLNVLLGCVLAVGISFGSWAGARLAHLLPKETLRLVVAWLMVAVGVIIMGKIAAALVH